MATCGTELQANKGGVDFDVSEEVFNSLRGSEGSGDDVTNVDTGDLGVTQAARDATGLDKLTPDRDVAKAFLRVLEGQWRGVDGFEELSEGTKVALLDSSYNMGFFVWYTPKLKRALAEGSECDVLLELLDTANVGGKSVKGIAVRRARVFNRRFPGKILVVVQKEDGTITYLGKNDVVIFAYKPIGGKHEKSISGAVVVGIM